MGMALSTKISSAHACCKLKRRTFVEDVAHRTVVQNSYAAQIRLNAAQILDVRAITECAVLAVIAALEELAFLLEPVDDRVGIFLNTGGEDDQLEPLTYLTQKLIAVWPLVHVVKDRMLRADDWGMG